MEKLFRQSMTGDMIFLLWCHIMQTKSWTFSFDMGLQQVMQLPCLFQDILCSDH